MKTTILKQSLLLLSSATLLAACGGDGGDSPVDDFGSNPGESGAQALLYAYPDNGQGEVPTKAPIALRFTSNVAPGNVNQSVTLCCDDAGENLDFEVERVGGEPRGVLLTPTDGLAPGTQYTVEINDLRLGKGTAKDQTLTFTTRTLQEGPKSAVVQEVPAGEDEFQLSRTIPNGSELEPVMDFSAFRFQFTQPIDRATASYGDGNSVVLRDSEGAVVEAGLLVDGAYMTVDPTDDYLNPGETYTLTLGGLESTYGETFAGETLEFTPKDSSPRGEPGFLVQKITQSGTSRLTGKGINQVPVNGTLLGEDVNVTQAQSDFVIAELADVTQYTDVTPIRLPKGTLLEGTPIEMVKIGGEVDAGFGSGDVTMRVLSDATGYLVPNPYTENHPDKLRIVHLFMDVGIATANPQANGGFTQNLLHIHLVGVAEVDPNGGVLNIDATSMVEPDVLGQEYGYGLLSFQLQSYKDQTDGLLADARAMLEDTTPPTLQSWMPSDDKTTLQLPGEPIILNFDEPLDPESLKTEGALSLTADGAPLDFQYSIDGASVTIQPDGGLKYSAADDNPEYKVQLGEGITDTAGNTLSPMTLTFQLPGQGTTKQSVDYFNDEYTTEDVQITSPMLLSSYPGYPCVTDSGSRDLANGYVGRCAGGVLEDWTNDQVDTLGEPYIDSYEQDDNLPLMSLPKNQPIVLQFSKPIDPQSVTEKSFKVVAINADESIASGVPGAEQGTGIVKGRRTVQGRELTFMPSSPWVKGQLYRYTLASNENSDPATGIGNLDYIGSQNCDNNSMICGKDGHPLRTQPLGGLTRTAITSPNVYGGRVVANYSVTTSGSYFLPDGGGPNLDIFFKGAPTDNGVVQTLRSLPDADHNNNFVHEVDSITGKLSTGLGHVSQYWGHANAAQAVDEDGYLLGVTYTYPEPTPAVPDPNADPTLDPQGVIGLPNSAKILSKNIEGREQPWMLQNTGVNYVTLAAIYGADGANIGCGYNSAYDMNTGDPINPSDMAIGDLADPNGPRPASNPNFCPSRKFTYIKMGLNATVTNNYIEGKGLKVLIWPSRAISSSFTTYVRSPLGNALIAIPSGEQLMRMRYAKDANGNRTQPITGWIREDGSGHPVLTAEVDLYLDAPLIDLMFDFYSIKNNLHSYPISMSLSGPVSFTDDGRMVAQQKNSNAVDIDLKLYLTQTGGTAIGRVPMEIPSEGVSLQLVSEPVKALRQPK